MGSGLLRDKRHNDNSTGHTVFDYKLPTLVFAGSKDGLYRITRNAESYWHQVMNIDPSQATMFPIALMKGATHGSFMDDSMLPSHVMDMDLTPEMDQDAGYKFIAETMATYIKHTEAENDLELTNFLW